MLKRIELDQHTHTQHTEIQVLGNTGPRKHRCWEAGLIPRADGMFNQDRSAIVWKSTVKVEDTDQNVWLNFRGKRIETKYSWRKQSHTSYLIVRVSAPALRVLGRRRKVPGPVSCCITYSAAWKNTNSYITQGQWLAFLFSHQCTHTHTHTHILIRDKTYIQKKERKKDRVVVDWSTLPLPPPFI